MKGSIRQRSAGTWQFTVDLGGDARGRRRRKYVNMHGTKAQADAACASTQTAHKHTVPDADRAVVVGKCLKATTAANEEIEVLVDIAG